MNQSAYFLSTNLRYLEKHSPFQVCAKCRHERPQSHAHRRCGAEKERRALTIYDDVAHDTTEETFLKRGPKLALFAGHSPVEPSGLHIFDG